MKCENCGESFAFPVEYGNKKLCPNCGSISILGVGGMRPTHGAFDRDEAIQLT